MAKQDGLHALIRSLSKSEKRYFKVSTASNEHPQRYLELFEVLAGMQEFDPEEIREKMNWENFRKSYPMAKQYLQDKVLWILAEFQKKKDPRSRLKVLISQIEILINRNLHGLAHQKIAFARRLAIREEVHVQLLEILILSRRLLIRNRHQVFSSDQLADINAEIEQAIEGIHLQQHITKLQHRLFTIINAQESASESRQAENLKDLVEQLQALDVLSKPYFFFKIYHHNILNQCFYLRGELEASASELNKSLALFGQETEKKNIFPKAFLATVSNYGNRCLAIRNFSEALRSYSMARDFRTKGGIEEILRLESVYNLGLALICNAGEAESNHSFLAEAIATMEKRRIKFSRRMYLVLLFLLAVCDLQELRFSDALQKIRELIEDVNHRQMRPYRRLLPLLEMLIHYELGNMDLLEYLIRNNLERAKNEEAFAVEAVFCQYLRQLVRATGADDIRKGSQQFLEHIVPLENETSENAAFNFFHFRAWAEGKYRNLAYGQVLRQNWQEETQGLEIKLD